MLSARARQAAASAALALLVGACATTDLPPISAAGPAFQPLDDEVRLWEEARAEESKMLAAVQVYDDPLLVDYLEGVVRRITPAAMAANRHVDYRLTVLEEPTLNAFAYPHGAIYVHTGLLARMENEDQLATVLGHETSHVEGRHMLRFQRSARNRQIGFSLAAIAAAVVLAQQEGNAYESGHYGRAATYDVLGSILVTLGLQLAFVAAVNGYGRDLEREADRGAFAKLGAAGYDLAQAPRVYELLAEERDDPRRLEQYFFGSHPMLVNRIANARQWLREHPRSVPPADGAGDGEFVRRMRPVVRDDARLNLEAGRLELARAEIERVLPALPEDPETQLVLGRVRLAQSEQEREAGEIDRLVGEARAAFAASVRLDPDRPIPHRELGLLAYRLGERGLACTELARYVELAPQAADAGKMDEYVRELAQGGDCG